MTEPQIIKRAIAVLLARRSTTQELALSLQITKKQAANALHRLRCYGSLHMELVAAPNPMGRRRICRYWLEGFSLPVKPVPTRPVCEVCKKNLAYARGRCRKCDEFACRKTADVSHLIRQEPVRAPVYRTIDGVEFLVTFSGRESLFPDRAGMHSALAGLDCRVMGPVG